MYDSLNVFTSGENKRPKDWKTGAEKCSIASKFIKK